ncbi:MAG: hypothetical protein QM709_01810 [Spongiibacteraceae bacterium]
MDIKPKQTSQLGTPFVTMAEAFSLNKYLNAIKRVKLNSIAACILLTAMFLIAALPERPARLLTTPDLSTFNGAPSSVVPLQSIPRQFLHTRQSIATLENSVIFRSWTPDHGVVPFNLTSSSFIPTKYMVIPVTGTTQTQKGLVTSYLECEFNKARINIFRGSVNVNVNESIVALPMDWCPGKAHIVLESSEREVNVGIGGVYAISMLSYLKQSFIGRLPYFLISFLTFAYVMFAGASFFYSRMPSKDPLPAAFISLGLTSLLTFFSSSLYSRAGLPPQLHCLVIASIIVGLGTIIFAAGREARGRTFRILLPYGHVWFLGSLILFIIGSFTYNGLGNWEPNFRFWPAAWSSDNELPWMFAEAIRTQGDLKGLFGGGWLPTDRPPLMAGSYLVLSDVFDLLQTNNDGRYLVGATYNAAAIPLNSLWMPAVIWLLASFIKWMDQTERIKIVAFMTCIPFIFFNSIYGWPKAYGAAFSLMAFGLWWQTTISVDRKYKKYESISFFLLGTLSLMAHMSATLFLAPLGLAFLILGSKKNFKAILLGMFLGLTILGSWEAYKSLVLPSSDPLTKYALAGDYGFNQKSASILDILKSQYQRLGLTEWLQVKRVMLTQAFWPTQHPIAQIGLNSDYGGDTIDKLRSWDFMLLSKGNAAIPIFTLLAAGLLAVGYTPNEKIKLKLLSPMWALIYLSWSSWLLTTLIFLVPPVLIVWPQAALLGSALGAIIIVYHFFPKIFRLAFVIQLAYLGTVWIIQPLHNAISIDIGAILTAMILLSYLFLKSQPAHSPLSQNIALPTIKFQRFLKLFPNSYRLNSLNNLSGWKYLPYFIVLGTLIFSSYVAIRYINQPLVDVHAFRQTQTALTSFWMIKEGFKLNYLTPVIGYPWSIPFEFPIYQFLIAFIAKMTGLSIEPIGRALSFFFLLACAWPAFAISKRLNLATPTPLVFCALLWSAPTNLYWGRTFMIETAALFFSLAAIPFALDLIQRKSKWKSIFFYLFFGTAAMLQKATTGAPIILFLGSLIIVDYLRADTSSRRLHLAMFFRTVVLIAAPLMIGIVWTHYADLIKMRNPMGSQLTSQSLNQWNFGTLQQRLSASTWSLIVWERCLKWNAAGPIGLMILIAPWLFPGKDTRYRNLSGLALALFILPLIIFTNVHFVHEYYQVACLSFLLMAIALIVGGWTNQLPYNSITIPVITLVFVISNVYFFSKSYGVVTARSLDELDPRSVQAYRVGKYLEKAVPIDQGLVIFGQDYSSEIAYQAKRKSMTAPPWFKEYRELWKNPTHYLGDIELGAIVVCPVTDSFPSTTDVDDRLKVEAGWRLERISDCLILLSKG